MPLLRRVAFCQKGVSSQTFVKKLREIFYYPGAGRAGLEFSKCPASGLRIKTEINGFPGNRTQTGGGRRAEILKMPGIRFAHQNRNQRVSEESYANRGGRRAEILKVPGIRFAYQNRNQRVSEESYANRRRPPGLQAFGWRSTCTKKAVLHFFLGDLNKRTNLHRSATA